MKSILFPILVALLAPVVSNAALTCQMTEFIGKPGASQSLQYETIIAEGAMKSEQTSQDAYVNFRGTKNGKLLTFQAERYLQDFVKVTISLKGSAESELVSSGKLDESNVFQLSSRVNIAGSAKDLSVRLVCIP